MFKTERNFLWPREDEACCAVVFDTTTDLEICYTYLTSFNVAVQAGGNMGVWPKYMAKRFKTIYTFEADPVNFYCLARNIDELNVIKFQAALGFERKLVDLRREPQNAGAHFVEGSGSIPTLRIDDLGLTECDFIMLDIEGYEFQALLGAEETIRKFKPLISIEDKGLSDKYGTPEGHIEKWLGEKFGYEVVARPHRDVILKCT